MKKLSVFLCMMFCLLALSAQNKPDDIIGYYYSVDPFSKEGSQTCIYKNADGKYEGKVCWVENVEKKHFLGHVFLKNLSFNEKDNEWQQGVIKYPGKNGTYKMYMKFEGDGRLKVRGYWGVAMLGKTMYWSKETSQRVQQ